MKTKAKNYFLMTVGTLIMAVGVYFFKFPNHFTFGGITGLAIVIAKTGVISASDFSSIANIVLLLLGLVVLGKKFATKTAYCSLLLSGALMFLERVYPMSAPFTDQPVLELSFAIVLPALGSAILFNIGASSGGTDVIAMILKKYTSVNIGNALFISDVLISISGFFVFGVETGLYSTLGLSLKSFMTDGFIENLNLSKYFNVVCKNPDPICDYITHTLNRSATIVEAEGAFSGERKYIIFTALNRFEAVKLRNHIRENSPDAFMLISNTSEIIGKGFHSI